MRESKAVPQIRLEPRYLPAPLHIECACLMCEFRLSAVSEAGLLLAMEAHTAYVIACKDRASDEHFHEQRMNDLLA